MADTKTEENSKPRDPAEIEFRKKNLWHSFTGSLYRGIGGASFFGLLVIIVRSAIDIAANGQSAAQASLMFGVSPLLVMGAFAALGTACIYMAERESTKLKVLEDNYRVQLQAKERAKQHAPEQQMQEQSLRADGKNWTQATQISQTEHLLG